MTWQFEYTVYVWLPLSSVVFAIALSIYGWRHRTVPGATAFVFLISLAAVWCLLSALAMAATDPPTKLSLARAAESARALAFPAAFCFVLEYAGLGRWLTRRTLALLAVPPLAFALLAFTNEVHYLAWAGVDPSGALALGPAGWLFTAYIYLLFLVSTLVLIRLFLRSPIHRWPVAIILVGQLVPRVGLAAGTLGNNPFSPLDLPLALANVPGVAYAIALFRFGLFDVVPVARETVLERMVDGMLVLDARGRLVDLNPAAQRLLGIPRAKALGLQAADILAVHSGLSEICLATTEREAEFLLEAEGERRYYGVRASPLIDRRGFRLGRLLTFRDITETKRAQEMLVEQQRALAALQERERVARELHDGLGQVLGFVKMQAQAAQGLIARDPKTAESYLARLASVAQDAHADIREYILGARAADADPGFRAPLRHYLERFSVSYGLSVEMAVPPELKDETLAPAAQVQLLRIIQEALTNARKHAHATHVQVKFAVNGGEVEVTVADDGQGFDPGQVAGDGQKYGLRFMRERAEEVGGTLEVQSAPGQSTRVVVRVPRQDCPVATAPDSKGTGAPED